MENLDWIIGIILVIVASTLRGLSGFGSAMILTPGLSILFNPQEVVVTVISLEIVATAILLPNAISKTKWQEVFPMSFAAILMIPVGVIFLNKLDAELIRMLIGILLLVTVFLLFNSDRYNLDIKPSVSLNLAVGAFSGFLTSLTSMGGIPIVLYQFLLSDSATEKRATFISFFAFTQIIALISYLITDLLSMQVIQMFLYFSPVFIAGIFLGRFLFTYVKETVFNKLIIYLLFIMSLLALFPTMETIFMALLD
ncbi:sulfite exporter TauE/SafE family protein [Dactylococcopsis salina]|uniref:Probable membrane transporter protein n=1 Tax=Dactylococcopsis salina (strain PCC 8305) TaxID=13035 RepID=K9YSX4_DACS8|nr:sulfite exporter TauE/SafE family protein [Dactylococcopsis salina]AFZ50041.1 putative permease [Dactylococcopsis salina PCC 8305]